jgi:hypothetical protein
MKRYSGLHDKLCTIENVEIKLYFILYIDLIIFLLILKLLNMTGVFMLKIEKKKLNLKHNIL